jgi:hypothetical protein
VEQLGLLVCGDDGRFWLTVEEIFLREVLSTGQDATLAARQTIAEDDLTGPDNVEIVLRRTPFEEGLAFLKGAKGKAGGYFLELFLGQSAGQVKGF